MTDDYDPDNDPELFDGDDADYCCHEDAELDWEGTFHCYICGHRWDATVEQMNAYWQAYDDANRPPTVLERMREWWYWAAEAIKRPFRSRKERDLDDDIPF